MTETISSIMNMTIARMPFLSARERIKLANALRQDSRGTTPLAGLCLGDLEIIVQRRLAKAVWNPAAWAGQAEKDMAFLARVGGAAVSYLDYGYPAILRETARPPFMLYIRGRLPDPDKPALAIVGTRYPTGRGLDAAMAIGREAGEAGVPVISGLARGVDSAAHRGALSGGGVTFAILGRGIDTVYPQSNKELASRMVASGGGLASEYPPGTPPSRWTFPERNRILAGLCRSTVVVEAPGGSGALISAAFALEEGRDVYVVASCMGGIRSAGSDALASDGAVALTCFADIIQDWREGNAHKGPQLLHANRRCHMRRPGRRTARTGSRRPSIVQPGRRM